MRYSEARADIKTGDIIALSHAGWRSKSDIESQAVRVATRSEFSHVAVVWVSGGRVFVIEAVVPMVRIYPLSKLSRFYLISMPEGLKPEAEEYALRRVGEPYSKWEAIKGFFNRNAPDSLWQCAELVKSVYAANGTPCPGKATPTDVVEGAMMLGGDMTLVGL